MSKPMDKPATPLPWAYRPQEHDDWGIIRMSGRDEDGFMRVVCRVNYVASPEELSAHRMAGTDPAGQDAAYIVHACNAYPHLTAINAELVEALDMARDLIQEAKGADGPNGGFITDHLDAAQNWIDSALAALAARGLEIVKKEPSQ